MDYVFCTLEKFPCFLWETSVKSRSYAVIQVIKNIFYKYSIFNLGSQGRFIVPNGLFYKFIHDFRKQQPGRISGVLASQGDLWKTQKTFLVKTLNSFGVTNSKFEDTIMEEVDTFCHFLGEKKGGPVQGVGLFNLPVMSLLWEMTTGEKLQYDDEKLHLIM